MTTDLGTDIATPDASDLDPYFTPVSSWRGLGQALARRKGGAGRRRRPAEDIRASACPSLAGSPTDRHASGMQTPKAGRETRPITPPR